MITGVHTVLYARQPDAVRAFLRDVLGWGSVDAGHGWLIFALPPAELGVHPVEENEGEEKGGSELYLMCDDLEATVAELAGKGVELARPVHEAPWGRVTAIALPGGGELGLYQPKHPTALALARE